VDSRDLVNGADVELAGYGITDGKTRAGAGTLRKVEVKVSNAHFSATEVLFDQRNQAGACHGDSGGPAFLKVEGVSYLFGVTSRGYQDSQNDCAQYSIYTNILAQSSFIQKASQELGQ
jgi:secreted trypsin-like serine protease